MLINTVALDDKLSFKHTHAFTLIELLISISITSILTTIAFTSLEDFIVEMRVDNEISQFVSNCFNFWCFYDVSTNKCACTG